MPLPTKTSSVSTATCSVCAPVNATKSSANLNASSLSEPLMRSSVFGSAFTPTSETGWKKLPSLPAPFRPIASNWEAMYLAAISPPRAPVPRPSSKSSERNLMWARSRPSLMEVAGLFRFWAIEVATKATATSKTDSPTTLDILILLLQYFRLLPRSAPALDNCHRLCTGSWISAKAAEYRGSHRNGARLFHTAQSHASMLRFDHDHHPDRLQCFEQGVGYFRSQTFL